MNARRRLRGAGGFTLAETLLAVLILLMVSLIVANGVPAARNVYEKVTIGANAQVLLSTTVTALRDELGTARDVTVSGNAVTYYSADIGAMATISCEANAPIMLREYVSADALVPAKDPAAPSEENPNRFLRRLVTASAATGDLYNTYGSVAYADGVLTFSNLEVRRASASAPVASLAALKIRVISESVSDE